jgi:hypothetical protein
MSGKGSSSRPLSVSYEEYKNNWDSIFKKEVVQEYIDDLNLKNDYQDILSTYDCFDLD